MMQRKAMDGVLQSVGSTRTYYYRSICDVKDEDLPEEYIIPYLPKLKDQGGVNSCVAHALAETAEVGIRQQTGEETEVSIVVIYGLWRDDWHKGEGMFPETAIKNGRDVGTCLKALAPENIEVVEAIDKAREYKEKYPDKMVYKVGNYFKFRKDEEFFTYIKKALIQFNLPIVVTVNNGGKHAEVIVGWNKDGEVILQNSWGSYGAVKDGLHDWQPKNIEEAYLVMLKEIETPFSDVSGHWAEKHIRNLYFAEIMQGYEDGSFKPEGYIKRGEAAKIIDMVMKAADEKIQALEKEIQELKKAIKLQ